jgi:hypothetical protein
MQPMIYNIRYYEGDSFTISVFPKDSTGAAIDLTSATSYFRVAQNRDDIIGWNTDAPSEITNLTPGSPLCIKCDMSTEIGRNIKNGYVYDIGYVAGGKRVTVLTGSFQVMSEVKTSGNTA